MKDLILIAVVRSVFNNEGFVLVDSYSDFNDRFFNLKTVYIEFFGNSKEFIVEKADIIDNNVVLKIKGFDNYEDAALLINKNIYVDIENAVKLDNDTYFIHDLIDSEVYRNGKLLGYLKDVIVLKSNDVYVIKDLEGREILIPAVKDYIKSFDPKEKRLELVEDCDLLYDED
ncbi:ribosome maturation factor RimM [Rosettibacter firmus]|uniref:ribosome maturation factor RimM n=1 Tax=Rosettibacter firmus TaxID=3111522 RepID=UPI00336BDBEF